MMKGLKLGLAAGVALGVLAGTAAPSRALEPGEAIALREAMMDSMGAHMGAIKAAIGAGNGKMVAAQARALAALAPTLPYVFPKGSGPDAGKTRAQANIWTDWDKFKGIAMTLQTEAVALMKVAGTNDKAKMAAQFGKMAKMGCGACHGSFRAKKK
jgi:cytochrome c556